MTSDQTDHTARQAPSKHGWEVSWPPGQLLDRDAAITAMVLADTAAERDLHEGHRLWPYLQGWAAELGLTGHDAVARTSQPPGDIRSQQKQDGERPGPDAAEVLGQHNPRRNADDRTTKPSGPLAARDRR
jgi:hypothetical protein